jgi:diamine N-acetyltransferase
MPAGALESPTGDAFFVLCKDSTREPIGLVGLTHIDREVGQAELFKVIGSPGERGKGYAKRATKALLDYGFNVLRLNRVYLLTTDGNMKNICLNQDLGFEFEGLLRQAVSIDGKLHDLIVMALLREDRTGEQLASNSASPRESCNSRQEMDR